MMPFKYILIIIIYLFSPYIKSEEIYIQSLAERHAAVFTAARERLIYLMKDVSPSVKELINSTNFKIGSFDKLDQCGLQSMYSTYDNGTPVIVYCPTGYRITHDFGEGLAYINIYLSGLEVSIDDASNLVFSFAQQYTDYLLQASFSIITRSADQSYPKLCHPLLFVYLFVHKINPKNCIEQANKYDLAVKWMYEDESYGAVTEEKLKRAIPIASLNYSKELRKEFITDTRWHAQAGQWLGLLYHELFHIINGDLDRPPKSPAENKERELKADEFAIKMIILDDLNYGLLRIYSYNNTQAFSGAFIDSEDFTERLKLSYLESIKLIMKIKDSLPSELYQKIMDMYEAKCKNIKCTLDR